MDKDLLIQLLQNGLEYPVGKFNLWSTKRFDITVRPDQIIELEEYQTHTTDSRAKSKDWHRTMHVLLHPDEGWVVKGSKPTKELDRQIAR